MDITDGDEAMPYFPIKQRLKIALGGFVFFTGLLLVVITILTATKTANLESILPNELIIAIAAIVGILDVGCGVLLLRRK